MKYGLVNDYVRYMEGKGKKFESLTRQVLFFLLLILLFFIIIMRCL